MKFIFVFILLTTLSIVNAMPHQLHKRALTFLQCPAKESTNLLAVTVSPDPLVPGGVSTFTVTGKLSQPATTGSKLAIGLTNPDGSIIGTPTAVDVCSLNTCPVTDFAAKAPFQVPANLPEKYAIVVLVTDQTAKTVLGCAVAVVGLTGPGSSALKMSSLL